jgi:LETM1 and EF-hand domain-containing protein 1
LCLHATIALFFRIKEDDKLIQEEGVDSLSEAELREDCRERGMLGLLSVEEMRQQVFVLWTVL